MCPRWVAAVLSLSLTGGLVYSFVSVVGLGDAALNAAGKLPLYIEAALESVRPDARPAESRPSPPKLHVDRLDGAVAAEGGTTPPAHVRPKARAPTP